MKINKGKRKKAVKRKAYLLTPAALIILLLPLLGLAGCWDKREPNLVGIITVAAFDLDPESGLFRICAQLANPIGGAVGQDQDGRGGSSQKQPIWVVETTGHTVFEAIKNMELLSTRELLWTHLEVVIFTEELARKGLKPVLDFFDREREVRLIAHPFVAQGDVRRLLKAEFPTEQFGGAAMSKQFQSVELEHSVVPELDSLRILFHHLSSPGIELILPRAAVLEEGEEEKEKEGEKGGKSRSTNPVRISGAAVFQGDKLVGFLNDKETKGYLWITGNIKRNVLVLKCPGSEEDLLTVEVFESKVSLKPEIEGDRVRFNLSISTEGRIQDYPCPDLPVEKEFIEALNRRMAAVVRNEIEMALEKARELRSDVFGLGNVIYRTRPRDWKRLEEKWKKIFPSVLVDIEVQAVVRRHGLIVEPIKIR